MLVFLSVDEILPPNQSFFCDFLTDDKKHAIPVENSTGIAQNLTMSPSIVDAVSLLVYFLFAKLILGL